MGTNETMVKSEEKTQKPLRRYNSFSDKYDTCQRILRDVKGQAKGLKAELAEFINYLEAIDYDMTIFKGLKTNKDKKKIMFGT